MRDPVLCAARGIVPRGGLARPNPPKPERDAQVAPTGTPDARAAKLRERAIQVLAGLSALGLGFACGNEFETIAVAPAGEGICSDQVDNDGDGLTDCADPNCEHDSYCEPIPIAPAQEWDCDNQLDDDDDGRTDCDDVNDCSQDPYCEPVPVMAQSETDCANAIDDDNDGDGDCCDSDCIDDPACTILPIVETSCSDEIDNDCDGATNCEDPDCDGVPPCA